MDQLKPPMGFPVEHTVHSRCGFFAFKDGNRGPGCWSCSKCGVIDPKEAEPVSRWMARQPAAVAVVDELTEFVHAKHAAVRQQVQAQRDSELAYVCRCGQQFTRGGGDGSDGERAYLEHIGYADFIKLLDDKLTEFVDKVNTDWELSSYWKRATAEPIQGQRFPTIVTQLNGGCKTVTDLFPSSKQALCWYGRHRAQIANMELNAHPDAEVRRLSAIVDQNTTTMLAFQQATDTINAIVAYIRSEMPEELGQPVDQIVVRLLQRYKKLLEATK